MSEVNPSQNVEQGVADLNASVLPEVLPAFRASTSPRIRDADVPAGVALLLQLIAHRVGDLELDAVGDEIIAGLNRWFHGGELVKLADRYEPFCKFILRVIDHSKFVQLKAETGNRLSAAKVLKALGLVNNKALSSFESCAWDQFPPADVVGQPDFLEHIARTYVFRNVDDHQARILSQREKAQIAESVCVVLVWCVIKFRQEIHGALTTARCTAYLEEVRSRFAAIGTRFVELTTGARAPEEYRFLNPVSTFPDTASSGEATEASKLSEVNRVTFIEAEPGAGKTRTLQFLAWQQADGLLSRKTGCCHVPIYLELKLLSHRGQTIEAGIEARVGGAGTIPWDSLLLLVDGVNEVAPQCQTNYKAELHDLISRIPELRAVVAGRPNSFRGEFEARIVVLQQRLSDKQLADLFQRAFGDAGKAVALLASVRQSPFLSSWAGTPLHAAMVAGLVQRAGLASLTNHAAVVRRCVRGFIDREKDQASAGVNRTDWETKELLLARLAFETKCANQGAFSRITARSILATAKAKIGATSLDVSKFLEEVRDNHLLQQADHEALEFAHELYHDYFAATELEAREQMQAGLGVEFVLSHFSETQWYECVRLFAGISNTSQTFIMRGAEKNPLLAWQLLQDASDETPALLEVVADEAYCALSAELKSAAQATMAGACIFVLAHLGRADLLEQAISEQRQIFEPEWRKLTDDEEKAANERQKQVVVPLAKGLLLLVRLGLAEQEAKGEGRFCQAARSAIRGLERIKAARALILMLSVCRGDKFDASALLPGTVLNALIDMGVDEVLDREDEAMNRTLAEWLKRASEAGFSKAWPAYGRVLRLARRVYVAETGLEFDGDTALKWLRQSHEIGDSHGTLELALLLIEKPGLSDEAGEGERMLKQLTQTNLDARYELGLRLLKGEGLLKSEAGGFEQLLSAAESGHAGALREVNPLNWLDVGPPPHITLPAWAKPYRSRLQALFPNNPFDLH